MASSYWKSSQFEQWLFDRQELMSIRLRDMSSWSSNNSSLISEDDYLKILIFYSNIIQHIGEQYKVRQQVIATAIIYLKRFYARYPLKSIDPWLLCPTCLFLAAKVEEFSTLNHPRVCNAAATTYKKYSHLIVNPSTEYPYQIKHILECEFYLLEIMDCCLIVYHPYRSLDMYTREFQIDQQLFEASWRIINDSLKTDAPLLYPPYEIALACLLLAATYRDKMAILKQYMIDAQIDIERIYEVVKYLLKYYELMANYDADPPHDGKHIKEILSKIPKPKITPNEANNSSSTQSNDQQGTNSQQNNNN